MSTLERSRTTAGRTKGEVLAGWQVRAGRWRSRWRDVRTFVFVVFTLAAFRSAVADWNDVPTGSMMPTILVGDRIFVNPRWKRFFRALP